MSTPLATLAHPEFLVEAEWLAAHLGEPDLHVIDCTVHIRFDPTQVGPTRSSGREDFERGHIPGAQFVDVVTELSDPTSPLPCMAPSAAQFAAAMSRLGVGNASRVVLYSAQNTYWAVRVWWLLRMFGFDNAAVLDGGWQKWRREGRPTEAGPAMPRRPSRFVIHAQRELIATKAEVLAAIGDPSVCTINALPADQHLFTSGIHYGRPGHIAGSLNVPAEDLLDPTSNEFLPGDRLRQRFENVGAFGRRVITYCGAGSAASADAMALMMLGHPDVRLYDGSLCEWAADPSLPMEAAPVPPSSEQAIASIENTRLLAELHEALAREHATAEVLKVINASPGDLAPVFDAILEKAHKLCGVSHGSLQLYEDGRFRAVALRATADDLAALLRQPIEPKPGVVASRLIDGQRYVQIDDMVETARRLPDDPRAQLSAAQGLRTGLFVPLRKEADLLGYVSAFRDEVRPFSDKEIALLENFAVQAVIAMENARLLSELRQRTEDLQQSLEYQTATSDVLKVISRTEARLESALETLVATATRICAADQGAIHQLHDALHFVSASFGTNPEYRDYVARNPIAPGRGTAIGRMALERRAVHIEDVLGDPEYTGSEFQRLAGFRSVLAVPLFRDDAVIGSILLTRARVEPFTDKQIEFVRTFADQAVIAIENARLLNQLRERTEEVAGWNREPEARVAAQVDELGRVGRLKRFLAPQLAELIVSQGDEKILENHRREIVVVFCDLRGFTAFTETAEPEEVLDFLREYHGALGPLVSQFEGTLDQFSGDGIMVFFDDPVPIPDPAERAVNMAVAMREAAGTLIAAWRRRGRMLGFGAGIAQGYATLGQIGFADRSGYTAIGTVCNLAARRCAEAKDGQILIAQRVAVAVEEQAPLEEVGELTLKGLTQPVVAYNVPTATIQPALRVIEGGGPQNG